MRTRVGWCLLVALAAACDDGSESVIGSSERAVAVPVSGEVSSDLAR